MPDAAPAEAGGRPETIAFFASVWSWITAHPLAAAGIVLAAAALVFLLLRFRRKRKGGAASSMNKENGERADVAIGNAHHIGARDSQQDAFVISDLSDRARCRKLGVLAVVADGMGGLSNGAEMSRLAARYFYRRFAACTEADDPASLLLQMTAGANDEICRRLGPDGLRKSGTTLVAVLVRGRELYWVSVGDSRICLIRGGAMIQINREHTYGSELDERAAMGELTPEQARDDPERKTVTSFLGMGRLEKIDRNIRPLRLLDGDRVLLMTDGVFNTLTDEEILSVLDVPAHESAAKLEALALSRALPGQDNLTAVVIECIKGVERV